MVAELAVKAIEDESGEESSGTDEGEEEWMIPFRKRNVFNHWGEGVDPRGDDIWTDCAEGAD